MANDEEVVKRLGNLLDSDFKLTRVEDRSAYLHLRLEDGLERTADIIKPFEDKEGITVISDLINSERFLKQINDITGFLRSSKETDTESIAET